MGFINLIALVIGIGYSVGIIARDTETTNIQLTIHDKTFNAYLVQNLEKALVYKTGKSIVVILNGRIS